MSATTGTMRRPARCQAEGKANSKIKATAEPAGVIDMLAPPSPRHPRVHSLRGSWRLFLLSFNLTFPANGQPGVNSTALIATRQSPTGSVRTTEKEWERDNKREREQGRERERERELGGEITPPCSSSTVPGTTLLLPSPRLLRSPSTLVSSATFSYSATLSSHGTMGMLISTLRSRLLISR